ncbi:Glycosyltransferase, GT2 family [Desulfonauticus submarinus]|uniref:Glycosyltransferase, GT2 family n=1 Tax=Desulfonauticus submarinus TaxID=206665 RepID=A0A1H0BF12_9BACT|nr:glycosyltransferase [Desulfonauticus submarinus]SDN44244.1 Glycosyltransferase, GT2 family [Desulfonauticus submarinus]
MKDHFNDIEQYMLLMTLQGKYNKIVSTFQQKVKSLSPFSYYLLGNAFFKLHKYEEAIIYWNKSYFLSEGKIWFAKKRAFQLEKYFHLVTGEKLLFEKEPKVHVLILTNNRKDYLVETIKCLNQTEYDNCEVFILDNGSIDGTKDLLSDILSNGLFKKKFNFFIHSLPTNIGRPAGHNFMLTYWDHSEADFIAILDDDVLDFPPNWLKLFLNSFTYSKNVAAVGSKTLSVSGKIQDAFPIILENVLEDDSKIGFFTHRDEVDFGQYDLINNICDYVTGCFSVFKKSIFDNVGLFDIMFSPSQYVDIDHGIRMRLAGYDLLYNGNIYTIHAQLTHEERKVSKVARGNQLGNSVKLANKYGYDTFKKIITDRKQRESIFLLS